MKKMIAFVLGLMMVFGMVSMAAGEGSFTLTAPSGAPAIAVAGLAQENPENYTFIAADTIAAAFASANSDFIIAPINAGAKLFKAGKSTYKLAAVITWGNLVFASQKENFQLSDINGAKVTLFGENTINASIALYVLEQEGVVPETVEYLAGAAQTQQLLVSDPEAIVLTAEPAVTAAKMKFDTVQSCPIKDELTRILGRDGYAQAGLFVKAETLEADPEGVKAYLESVKTAADATITDVEAVAKAAVALEILPNEKVAVAAIPGCSIKYVPALEAKEMVEFTANIDLSQFGGELPADDFYYGAE
ncbi:MAG: hypothetical protein IJK06_12960 [Clostridia bacterium]|nr:hypothetical protein [Clostridia bacterium]